MVAMAPLRICASRFISRRLRIHVWNGLAGARLAEILVMAVLAVIAGADGWEDTVVWAKARRSWLKTFLVLRWGIPCEDTFRRVFRAVDPTKFAACFASMTAELAGSMLDQLVATDGKTMRRTFARERGQKALHMITAWVAERGVQLGQLATEEKSNEITAIPALLATLDVRGATVTIDAEGCQKKIAEKIVDGGANYLLALKANNPLLHQEVVSYFEHAQQDRTIDAKPLATHETTDKGHGRLETRRVWCSDAPGVDLALLRKLALALLKREQSDPRMSIKMKRRRVGWDNDYLFTVLAAIRPDPVGPIASPGKMPTGHLIKARLTSCGGFVEPRRDSGGSARGRSAASSGGGGGAAPARVPT
jgi:predicted transposase YbfD/YdcC